MLLSQSVTELLNPPPGLGGCEGGGHFLQSPQIAQVVKERWAHPQSYFHQAYRLAARTATKIFADFRPADSDSVGEDFSPGLCDSSHTRAQASPGIRPSSRGGSVIDQSHVSDTVARVSAQT